MLTSRFFLSARRHVPGSRTKLARAATARVRPQLEVLEDRLAPAVAVSTTTDNVPGSLRDAISQVNAGTVADNTIILPAGNYVITVANPGGVAEDNNASGDLDIRRALILQGAGAGGTTIDGGGAAIGDRVLDIIGNVTVNISGVTIRNGNLSAAPTGNGGGIHNAGGTLTVTSSVIRNNSVNPGASDGGGIASGGTLNLVSSTVSTNSGGGLAGGGGIAITAGTATITDSTIVSNSSPNDKAGGILNDGTLAITGSTISGNTAGAQDGGGLVNGFANVNATTTITNSTFSGNTSSANGGALAVAGGTVNLNFVTITSNTVTNGDGGGIFRGNGTVNVRNSLVAANTDQGGANNFPDAAGTFASQGNNLIGNGTGATGFTNNVNGDQVGSVAAALNPQLGPLQNNGGSTLTHALLAGSPAINRGNNASAAGLTNDQRGAGFIRLAGGTVDIGAFEAAALPAAATPAPAPAVVVAAIRRLFAQLTFKKFGKAKLRVVKITSSDGTINREARLRFQDAAGFRSIVVQVRLVDGVEKVVASARKGKKLIEDILL